MKIKRNKKIAFRKIDGKFYLVNPETSCLHCLDEVGSDVWNVISRTGCNETDFDTLVDKIFDIYNVDRATLKSDLAGYVQKLIQKGLIISDG
jgi:hypothetical protein